jgi:hypothetical protein
MSNLAQLTLPEVEETDSDLLESKGAILLTQQTQANPSPCISDPVQSLYLTKGYTMKLRAGTKKVTLFRFLLAKLVHGKEEQGLSLEEFLVFHELYVQLLDSRDPLFVQKWETSLGKVSQIMVATAGFSEFPVILDTESRDKIRELLGDDLLLPSPEAYFGLMGNRDLRTSFRIQFRSQWVPPKRVERYIGVGYKDKGTRRAPELDGSPSWQRVATVLSNRDREAEESRSFSPSSGME